jgi:hypothetical protein
MNDRWRKKHLLQRPKHLEQLLALLREIPCLANLADIHFRWAEYPHVNRLDRVARL